MVLVGKWGSGLRALSKVVIAATDDTGYIQAGRVEMLRWDMQDHVAVRHQWRGAAEGSAV